MRPSGQSSQRNFKSAFSSIPTPILSKKDQILGAADAREYARGAAQRSMVLLKNDNHALPLRKDIASIALLGPLANDAVGLDGGWGIPGQIPSVTVEEGLRKKLPGAKIAYARGGEIRGTVPRMFDDFFGTKKTTPLTNAENDREVQQAVDLARRSDVSIFVMGELGDMSRKALHAPRSNFPENKNNYSSK